MYIFLASMAFYRCSRILSSFPSQQGFNWMLRKAVGLAAVTLHISLQGTPNDQNGKMPGVGLHLEILQVPTGGLAQIPESRILDDNQSTLLKDFLFGTRRSDNQLI